MCYCWLDSQQRFAGPQTLPKQSARVVDDSKPHRAAAWRHKPKLAVDQYHFDDFVGHELEAVLKVQQQLRECRIGKTFSKLPNSDHDKVVLHMAELEKNYVGLYPHPPRAGLRDRLYDWKAWSHMADV